ncbi:DMT family transporter [Actinomadura sp. NPDC048955]|uniref:Drug/metabolite transporter (DMT)-like permease n=1 Tax=Actinomadura luteofluorescens TaxID=46163 RepID=A0A7Y9JJ80_9ACTN|nr:DMT family transporter [Actinomadura luteofluorescens]NYD51187.1 drug/metabolite transporter (DMT)-like permease [Actinomadura luteofluorescens]
MGHDLGYAALALLATTVYYIAFLVFRVSARRMEPLRGSRPFRVARLMLTDPVWLGGGLLLFLGLGYEVVAFSAVPLAVAQPVFALGLVLLVAFAVGFLGERLSLREWASVALFVLATGLIGLSATTEGEPRADATLTGTLARPWTMLAVCAPAVIVAALVWLVGDRRAGGRHARRLAGVAYGIGAGACAGLAEAGIRGISLLYEDTGSVRAVLESPYPYLTIGLAAIALGQLQVALQRCRIAIVAVVLTVIGRTYLVLSSTVLFGEQWPRDTGPFALRAGGFALALAALALFPRYEDPAARSPEAAAGKRVRATP